MIRYIIIRPLSLKWDGDLSDSGGLKNVAGIFAKIAVWLPGAQCAVLGFVNAVTGFCFRS